jgi:alkylation response protein AidB-like acyl-CoA dehydrogenase
MVEAIVEGIGQFAAGEFAPLNRKGDTEGAQCWPMAKSPCPMVLPQPTAPLSSRAGTPWRETEAFGGQGLPFTLAANVLENLGAANMAFSLLPMLTVGAIEALPIMAAMRRRRLYLAKLVSGEWSGTMNLTEPQAGSDVGALRTRQCRTGDGRYAIKGTKIFITWGEHDLAQNIVHLVLARTPGGPKARAESACSWCPNSTCQSRWIAGRAQRSYAAYGLEHKLGIHASPTCVMSFGDNDQCIGELVGHENEGLKAMFTMMNSARINVGSQGVQIAERALQGAKAYALGRVQSARAGSPSRPVAIASSIPMCAACCCGCGR